MTQGGKNDVGIKAYYRINVKTIRKWILIEDAPEAMQTGRAALEKQAPAIAAPN
jgi:hypothetical protein